VLVGAGLGVALTAAPAAAHATVLATSPADGQSVPEPPVEFTVTFSEAVDISLGGLSVLDRDGGRVDTGPTASEDGGRQLRVALTPGIADGTYVGTWRVVSIDGHPISGSVLFAVGTAVDSSGLGGLTAGTEPGWEVAGAMARFATFTGALLAAGLAFFLAFVHDQRDDRWDLVPAVRVAAVAGTLGMVATVVVQAALATGLGIDAVIDLDTLRTVLTESIGWSALVLVGGLALVALSTATRRLVAAQALALTGWLVVSLSFVLWGHATEAPYRWISVLSDGAHVAAAALWFGGLVGLAVLLRRRGAAQHDDRPAGLVTSTADIVGRFSTMAAVSVALLLAAGAVMTYIHTDGSLTALWDTTYGRLVLTKVALVAVVLVVAAYNRRRLVPAVATAEADARDGSGNAEEPAPARPAPSRAWGLLRRTLVAEAAIVVAALAVTAVLVTVTPARTAEVQAGTTVRLTEATADGSVELTVAPALAGPNTLTVQYRDVDGQPVDIATDLTFEFTLPAQQLGPLARSVVKSGPGSFVLQGSELSLPGTWQITLAVRVSDFREVRTPFTVEIS